MVKTLTPLIPSERIDNKIYLISAKKVMVDADLAELYGVSTKRLNGAGKTKPHTFSGRLYVSVDQARGRVFEVAICDLKENRAWRTKI